MTRSLMRRLTAALTMVGILATGSVAVAAESEVRRVPAFGTHTWNVQVFAGTPVHVTIDGDRDTDLDLYIYDQTGRLVAVDDDLTDYCIGRFTPRFNGTVRVEIRNLGRVYNEYEIIVDGGDLR